MDTFSARNVFYFGEAGSLLHSKSLFCHAGIIDMPSMRPLIGIALGSGMSRGWAHIGVLNRLEAAGLKPDIVCGTSVGALIGGAYLANRMQEFEAWACTLTRAGVARLFDFKVGVGGLITGRRITHKLHPDLHRLMIEKLDRPYVAVATDLASGHEVWMRDGRLIDAMRASYAVPALFAPVRRSGRWLIDGALVNPVPVSVCRALGARLTIAVNLNADSIEEMALSELCPHMDSDEAGEDETSDWRSAGTGIIRSFLRRRQMRPSMLTVLSRTLSLSQDRIARSRLAGDPPEIMISPKLSNFGMFEFHRAAESIEAGAAAADKAIPEIRALLQTYSFNRSSMESDAINGTAPGAEVAARTLNSELAA